MDGFDSQGLRPGIGVAVAVLRDGALLLGRRIGGHGDGLWQTPGGKIDADETPLEAAVRETEEETGLAIPDPFEVARQFDDFPEIGMRYETIFFAVELPLGIPENREPAKCAGWEWLPLDDLPHDRFAIDEATIDAIRSFSERRPVPARAVEREPAAEGMPT